MIMVPIFVVLLEVAFLDVAPGLRVTLCAAATLLFIVASITDLIDGLLARRWDMVTDFGKLFDPLADKLLVTAALVIFVQHRLFGAWVVVVILCREFIITGLRSLGERMGRTIAADRWGKWKAISQFIAILWGLIHLTAASVAEMSAWWASHWSSPGQIGDWSRVLVDVLVAVMLIATVASGVTYLKHNWDLVSESPL
jgi:CDP-diacylglycerol---glycerol-3-phosphate 3-phosphatidyltransferase